ncbi:sulfotransferase [Streptomyces sp. NPDC001027]|uniref:sulfotransferase family protein n=1 Tax=Streptomyces sp. NPDC001027 TaxID=3154771 RepID=UPI0033215D08
MALTFVINTGRCGSTLLSQLLHEHPDVLSISELFGIVPIKGRLDGRLDGREFWRQIAEPVPLMDAMVRGGLALPEFRYPYETGRFDPEAGVPFISHMTLPALTDTPDALYDRLAVRVSRWPARQVADHYRHLFSWLASHLGRSVVVERTGGSITFVAELRRAFPEARFVYLSRDGVDCALSMSKHAGTRIPVLVEAAGTNIRAALAPGPVTRHLTLDAKSIMECDIPLPAFGARWSAMTRSGAAELTRMPFGIWTAMRYEQLLLDPVTSLRRLAGFLEVAAPPEWLSSAASQVDPARVGAANLLDPEVLAPLRAACSSGYRADRALHSDPSSITAHW